MAVINMRLQKIIQVKKKKFYRLNPGKQDKENSEREEGNEDGQLKERKKERKGIK